PEWCRWLNGDSIEYLDPSNINGMNLYAYCYNNPINYADPSGCFAISAILIGAVAGAFGAFGNAGLSFLGSFAGNMIESAYTFTSAENVGYAIWTSLMSGALAGGFTAASNKITKSYFDKSLSNASKGVRKQVSQFLKNTKKLPTKAGAIKLMKSVEKMSSALGIFSTISTTILGLFH
ncbi:MAG: hypothetical protein K2N64_01595, partial [Anaeroplasmataceae bacterium]|nr:hypothetical protein [Anaeroplasmataceae bacterium]